MLLLAFTIFIAMSASAYDFMVNDIAYNINDDGQSVTVTYETMGYPRYSHRYGMSIIIPETVEYRGKSYTVTAIGDEAFSGCDFADYLSISNSVTSIGESAFYGCSNLISITIPNSVTKIGNSAFYDCKKIQELTIANSVTSIGSSAFYGCSRLTSVYISDLAAWCSIDFSDKYANPFNEGKADLFICGDKVSILEIPEIVNELKQYTFYNCRSIRKVNLPNTITSIGNRAFCGCSGLYGSLTIPNSVNSIGSYAFSDCSGFNGSLTIPNSVNTIGYYAFSGCSGFTGSLTIPNSVTFIGDEAFTGCSGLDTLILPGDGEFGLTSGSLPSIGTVYIQSGITGLKGLRLSPSEHVYAYGVTPPECDENAFTEYNAALHVPQRSTASYFDAPYWNRFANIVGDAVNPESLAWEQDSVTIKFGENFNLDGNILSPANTGLSVSVESLNPNVASVHKDENIGEYIITSLKAGETDIIARCLWLETRCHVSVVDAVTLDVHELQMKAGTVAILIPSAPEEIEYTVTSSDRSVATARVINGQVQVAAAKPGTATITVGSTDGYTQPDSCLVTVIRPRGDATKDGYTDVDDLNAMINVILDLVETPENEDFPFYDLTGDGNIDVEDINKIINIILGLPELKSFTVNGVRFNMVFVEGGTFTMGATSEQGLDAEDDEKPVHQVTLSSFNIGQTEVTQELWLAVMGSNPSSFTGDLHRPVECVSWDDCQTFISKLNQLTDKNFRLPTEAEWEYAARGGNMSKGYKYAGSDIIDNVAWYSNNSGSTNSVGKKAANELGLYDMSGNVKEWCQDWWSPYGYESQSNPIGPISGSNRVYRGGSWNLIDRECRVTNRDNTRPSFWDSVVGFRLVLDNIETYKVNGVSFKMVPVEGGTFTMGATTEQGDDAEDDEYPIHQVTLSGYSIGQTEVTQELWQAVMGNNPSENKESVQLPVENVSWNDCQVFIKKLNEMTNQNFRLPTEAEWEYAARGGKLSQCYKYAGSNSISDVAWYSYNADGTSHLVGSKMPNELGLYDMSGNVYEWCQESYGSYIKKDINELTSSGSTLVNRGGSYRHQAIYCRTTNRSNDDPDYTSPILGLRLTK